MVTIELQQLLCAYIKELQGFFDEPSAQFAKAHGFNPDCPIDVQWGPDVETFLLRDNRNILSTPKALWGEEIGLLRGEMEQLLRDENLLWDSGSFGRWLIIDGGCFEHRLAPRHADEAIVSYLKSKEIVETVSKKYNIDAYVGNGHWYFSLSQNGRDLMRNSQHIFSDLFRYAGAGVLEFQEKFPAFFIKPVVAEKEVVSREEQAYSSRSHGYKGPKKIYFASNCSSSSLRRGNILSSLVTLEPRLCANAPYVPLALALSAMRYGIEHSGWRLDGRSSHPFGEYQNKMFANMASSQAEDSAGNVLKVTGGKSGYLNLLQQTKENLERFCVFSSDISNALLLQSIADYRDFLSLEKSEALYSQKEQENILTQLLSLESSIAPQLEPQILEYC